MSVDVLELLATARTASAGAGVRFFAVRDLGAFARADVVATLGDLLVDPDGRLRAQAARSLGRMGPAARPAVPALRHALFDGDGAVRVASARALGDAGDRSAVPDLVKAAETTGWDTLHAWVTDSLVRLDAPEAAEHLERRLSAEKAWQRRWAAERLGKLGTEDALDALRNARSRDRIHWMAYTQAMRDIKQRASRE
jgi:HEAT repeat protein